MTPGTDGMIPGTYGRDDSRYGRDDSRYGRDDSRYGRDDSRYGRDGALDDRMRGNRARNSMATNADLRACRDAISQRINRDGYTAVNILGAEADNNPGRNDYIVGTATARRGRNVVDFDFSCLMNFNNNRVRSVDLRPR
jgi:hypothetical protein